MGELKDIITGRQSSKKYRKDNFSNLGARSGDFIGRNLEPQHNSEMTIRKIVSGETEDTTGNNDTGKTSLGMTVNEMFNIINRKKNSNNTTGSDIKSFFNENLDKANSSAENLKEAIKNPNKSLNDRVKGLTHMYNAAVATGDTKTAEKMQKEYDELADRVNKQTEINRQNAETAEAESAKLAEQAEKEQKYADKYKNSTLEQRKNARIHATTEELDWLNKHMYDNSSSKELEDYNNQLNKEANSLWNQRDEEQAYNRLKAIEDEQGKLKTAINNAKLSEQKKKEYDDIVNNDIKAKTVLQKYYALQHYDDTKHMLASTGHDTDSIKNQVTLDDYNYINKLSDKERTQIEKNFKNLKKEGYDTESLYKWYERERDAEKAAETTRTSTEYANEHPVLGSIASVGARLGGAVPDAIKYISTDLDKKYNGGDGYINPEATNTAISDAMRAKVSENINNDFGSFLYNTGMSMADFASLLPLNAVPGGQALSLGIMGTSAGVGAANEVINNGGTIDNAVKTGIAAGIAETLFEKVSLEQLSVFKASGKSTFRAAVGNVLKGAFTEGSEEAFTDLANRLTDDAINKDLSSYNLSKKNYMEQGMSEAEAENAASWNFWKEVGLDFAGGAISGGVLNLATAGINLAGAKIDMAQNKESNAQIGKAVMADENFDLDLLIRQGLATDKNDRAYNYATKMQKLIETDNEGKISAGDVGNLMYLINREVAKNPELVNKIAQVKKQDTQEQGNKAVNVQSEQNPTQQNTAQNGQQNAEQAQASTAINATKKADTEDIGKMYGVYAFGKKHPNGIIATDTSTGKVVKVALKSLESSAKINRSDEENTLVFNTNDGKQVNADSITFSDSQLDAVVHSANEFDTYGARNYISNFEGWRESPQAQRMTDEEMLYKYNRAYSAAYSFGREGVKLDSLRETSEYKILKNILGEQIVSQALSTGRRDVDINTQHHANRLTELINRNGRADTSGVSVYADSGTDVSHIPQDLINTLGNLATKTGRNIIISDRLADGVNGVAKDGNIILSSEISGQKILATALHEAGHMIKKTNPTEWRTLSDFVSDYLVRKGVDLNKMIDRTIERYGNRLQADEHGNTRDAALEEIVCDTLMSIASDEKALNIALSTKQNKSKIAAAIKSLIAKVKDWLLGKSQNYGAKTFAKDLEALENLAHRFSEAADTARENITEQSEVQNGEKINVEKYSIGSTDNIVQEKFDDNVNKKINNITQSKQFIRWFGDWQNSPAKASKVVDNNGEPLVLYHQTGKEFTTFDAKQKGSGEFDSEMPTGIFMKPTNNDIGVGGNIQMPLYASIKNPLIVNNRSELVKFYDKNVQGYTKAKSAIDSVNKEYKAKFNEEMKRENEEYQKLWNAKKNGEISEEEYQKSISRDALDEIMEEWENKVNEASRNAKALIDDYFKNSNYDGVIVNNDVGSFGRSTKTFIAFENTQVKSATDNIGTFDGNNPDIRYSLDEEDKDLVATHNISSQNLMNLINDFDGAGMPAPSIAIEKFNEVHEDYGDVTLLFNKDTIDPEADSRNKVYSRDAWTSIYPETEYKLNNKLLNKLADKLGTDVGMLKDNIFDRTGDIDEIKEKLGGLRGTKNAFIKEMGIKVTPENVEREPSSKLFYRIKFKKYIRQNNITFDDLVYNKKVRDDLLATVLNVPSVLEETQKDADDFNKILDDCKISKDAYNKYKEQIEYNLEYAKGKTQKVKSSNITDNDIDKAVDEHRNEYNTYVDSLINKGLLEGKYIIDKDIDIHDEKKKYKATLEYNLVNVIKSMETGVGSIGDWLNNGISYGDTIGTQEFSSIGEIHNNEKNLKLLSEEEQKEFDQKHTEALKSVVEEMTDDVDRFIDASNDIVDAFKQSKTKNGVYNDLKQYYPALKKSTVDKLFKVRDEIANMPTRYFEAKPHRAVGFNEVMAAVIPADADESLKKALKRMNIPLYEYADESQRADAARKAINTEYTDKTGVIHDTLKFSIDDEYDDLFDFSDNGEQHIDFDKAIDKNNPELTIEQIYHHSARNVKEGLFAGKGIKPEQKKIYNMVKSVMRSYHINPNAETDSLVTEYVDALNTFIDTVQNDKSNFTDAFESFVLKCREALQYSTQLDEQHEAWAKEIRDELRGTTLLIPENAIDTIKENYGSVGKYKKALFGKINVKLEHNARGITGKASGSYIEDIGSHLENIGGRSLMIEDGFDWDSDSGYRMLDHIMNYVLTPQYVATYDGKFESESTIDAAAIQMAFDTTAEYLKQQGKAAVMQNNIDKRKLRDINKALRQAEKAKTALNQKTIENYKTDISEQKAKYNEQREKYRQAYNALKDKKSEQAKDYRDKIHELEELNAKQRAVINTRKKVIADEYRAERDKTKYRQKINTTLERLINRHLKPKPSNNVPISVVKPLYRLLSELTGNYSGFSKGVNDITEKTGYNKTDNQEGERVNKVTLSAETEKLILALNSEIANTDGKITLPPAMRNALLGYNVFDNNGNIKQHFTGLLEDVRNIFEKAEKNGKTSLKDFSLSELKRISTAFSEVKKLLDAANKIVINGKEYDAYLVSRKGAEELKKVTGTHKKGSNTQASTAKRTLLAYRKYMSDPIRFARMISGYHNDSVIVQLMDMLNQGQSDAEQLSIYWTNKYEEQMSRFSYKAKKDYVREQAMEFDGIDPNTKETLVDKKTGEQVKVGLTADMLVEMLLEYEDEYGKAHMMYSGYQVPNIKYIKRKNQQLMYSKDSGCYILPTESDISRIRDYVMNNEIAKTVYEICREMYNEDMQNAVNKVSNEKYGYEIAKVKNYCPITIDEDTVYGTFADVLINRSINSRAFLHERENFKYNRLKLKGATAKLTSQIKSVSSWCGLTMPIETFNRVFNMPRYDHKNDSLVKAVQEENLNSAENIRQKNNTHADEEEKSKLSIDEVLDFIEREEKQKKKKKSTSTTEYFPSMKEIMKQQWGNESEEYISKLMGDLQGSTKQADPGRIDMLTGKYIRAVLTANISSAIKQLSSYPLAAARVGWKATLAGLKHIRPGKHTPFLNRALPDSYKQSIPYDEIAKYTPILEYRKQGNNSREMAEISRYKGLIDSSGWVGHTLDRLNWIEKNDVLMVEMNYWIAYEHVKGNMGISPDSKEFMPNVAKTLEDIINNMMPNSSVMQQGQILRSKNPVNRIFTICKSQVFCMVNAAMDASGEYNARLKDYKQAVSEFEKEQARTEVKIAKKQLARTYSAIIVSTAMTCGILMPLIAALFGKWDRYRDEDGNITPWSVGSRLLKDFGSELTGMFLFGDTVYNTVLALIDKNEEFYGLSLPGVDTINDFITGIINIARSDTPEKLRKNISSLVGTLGMLTGLPTKNLMNLFQGACNHIENFTKYGGTPTVNDYGEVSMQMYANYCYEALIDGDKKKFAKLYSEWLKEKTSTGKQVDKSYINSKLKTELEDDTEIIAAGNAFFNGDLTAYENTVEKYSDLGFDKTTVVKAINSIVSDLEDEQKNAEGLDKYDNEEGNDSEPELYKYSDAFDFLKNGDTESYEKVEKYLMEQKGKTKNQMKKLMQSASRTDPIFEKYIDASKNNDADTTHTLYRQLLNIYGSESKFKSALKKYQGKVKKQQSK